MIFDKLVNDVVEELKIKPEIELLHKNSMGVDTAYIARIKFFKDQSNEFTDEYDVTKYIDKIMHYLQLVETEAVFAGNNKSVQEIYLQVKPKIKKIGIELNSLAGVWLIYSCLHIIYSLNTNYYELVDECWKKIGIWK